MTHLQLRKTNKCYSMKPPSASCTTSLRPQNQFVFIHVSNHVDDGGLQRILWYSPTQPHPRI